MSVFLHVQTDGDSESTRPAKPPLSSLSHCLSSQTGRRELLWETSQDGTWFTNWLSLALHRSSLEFKRNFTAEEMCSSWPLVSVYFFLMYLIFGSIDLIMTLQCNSEVSVFLFLFRHGNSPELSHFKILQGKMNIPMRHALLEMLSWPTATARHNSTVFLHVGRSFSILYQWC